MNSYVISSDICLGRLLYTWNGPGPKRGRRAGVSFETRIDKRYLQGETYARLVDDRLEDASGGCQCERVVCLRQCLANAWRWDGTRCVHQLDEHVQY